jgi:multimeric flavodoxin WrbA
MKKAVVLLGSPRKNGNSTVLANKVKDGITAAGGSHETFYLHGMNIRPCQACDACQKNGNKCVINDDMQLIYPKLFESNSIVLCSPIYMFTVSAQLKLFLDRCYAVMPALAGKKIGAAFAYSADNETDSGVMNAINAIKDECNFVQAEIVGIVHGSATDPGEITKNTRLLDEAYALGKALVK